MSPLAPPLLQEKSDLTWPGKMALARWQELWES